MMTFTCGIVISLCIFTLVNCSLFDLTRIVDNKDGIVRIRFGSSSVSALQELRLSNSKSPARISSKDCSGSKVLCQTYSDGTRLSISHWTDECILLNYITKNNKNSLKASFAINKIHLYGGPMNERRGDLNWPAEESFFVDEPYMNIETGVQNGVYYQAILEPYWLFSNGYYIYVDNEVPLFINTNSTNGFELRAENVSPYEKPIQPALALNFALCKLNNAREAHEHATKVFLGKPSKLPDTKAVTQPVWTTFGPAEFQASVNQSTVMDFAQKIIKYGYGGRLVIGNKWEKNYGSLEPNISKFLNFKGFLNSLQRLNFTVDLRVHPFVSDRVKLSKENQGYLVKKEIFDDFYEGYGRYIDSTKPTALNWFYERLLNLRKRYGIDSFEFYHGNYDGLTGNNNISNPIEIIMKENAKLLAKFNSNIVTNMARGTQKYGFFLTIPTVTDVQPYWRALRGVVPRLLQMNILGYSFTLSNVMGGNSKEVSREQYLRWVQLTVFMPSMQFSIHRPPWSYDQEIIKLTKKFVDLHASYSSYIIELMTENVKTGAPVNPPIWWISPNDLTALSCQAIMYDSTTQDLPGKSICRSEFLLGEKILVAPVVVEGQRKRDIYLPIGFWQDGNSKKTFNGPTWVKDYAAGLDTLPYFIRLRPQPFTTTTTTTATTTGDKNSKKSWVSRLDITYIFVILGIFLFSVILLLVISPQMSKSMFIKYKTFK